MNGNRQKNRDARWIAQQKTGAVTPGPAPPLNYPGRDILQTGLGQFTQKYDAKTYHEVYVYDKWLEYRGEVDDTTQLVLEFPFAVKKIVIRNFGATTTELFLNMHETNVIATLDFLRGTGALVCEGALERTIDGLAGIRSMALLSDTAAPGVRFRLTIFG